MNDVSKSKEELISENQQLRRDLEHSHKELNKSNHRYHELFKNSHDVLFIVDPVKGDIVEVNPQAEVMLGFTPEELKNRPMTDLHRDEIPELQAFFSEIMQRGYGRTDVLSCLTKSGEKRFADISAFLIDEDDNKLAVAAVRDVTERRQAERVNAALQKELQHAHKMESLGHLTGGVAHDFNNLLGIISGYTELALNKYASQVDERLIQYINNIREASKRAAHLVEQMLSFCRGDEHDDKPLNLSPLIKDDLNLLRSTLPSSIEIDTEIDPDLASVLMNPIQFHQILLNLSTNARDAMDGVGKLQIQLCWANGLNTKSNISHKTIVGDWIELSIGDTGSGIDPTIVQNIFDPFFTTKDVGKGTGLGLAVIYRIMESHGGHIILESEPGKGSKFRMLFPPIHKDADEINDVALEHESIPGGRGAEILVVDDESLLAAHMSELLKDQGYEVTSETDSDKASLLFEQQPGRFSMVITDQTMPNTSGVQLISRLRDIRPELPAIICSGYSNKIDVEGAAVLNISYLQKPVDADKLFLKIAELINADG